MPTNKYEKVDKQVTKEIMSEFTNEIMDVICCYCRGKGWFSKGLCCEDCHGKGTYKLQF